MNGNEFLKKLITLYRLKDKDVGWGIVSDCGNYMPGLFIKDSKCYVDIVSRRIRSIVSLIEIKREVFPASCVTKDGITWLEAKDRSLNLSIEFPIDELWADYKYSIYGEWMEEEELQ